MEKQITLALSSSLDGPTVFDFLKIYLWEVLEIELLAAQETENKREYCLELKRQSEMDEEA